MYKVGDKVRVKSGLTQLECARWYNSNEGKTLTIKCVLNNTVCVEENCYNWDFKWIEPAEPAPLFAYELMAKAKANPQEYKGKRYKVVNGLATDFRGTEHKQIHINSIGVLVDEGYTILVNSFTQLEEISSEPVTFMEAVNSGNDIKHREWLHYYPVSEAFILLGQMTVQQVVDRTNEEAWYIKP